MKKITYIITHKDSSPDRKTNLLLVLDWLNHINEIDRVIVVEQGKEPISSNIINLGININYKLDYRFITNGVTVFNKCWAYNHGAKIADTEWVAFGDNDVIMDIQDMNNSINSNLNICDSFSPYEYVQDLSNKETNEIILTKDFSNVCNKKKTNKKGIRVGAPYGGGIMFIKKQSFLEIGAWFEGFVNWGAEDDDISHRITNNITYKISKQPAFHLHHVRSIHATHQNEFYRDNLKIYLDRRDKPLEYILKDFDIDKIGLEDKYM